MNVCVPVDKKSCDCKNPEENTPLKTVLKTVVKKKIQIKIEKVVKKLIVKIFALFLLANLPIIIQLFPPKSQAYAKMGPFPV